MKSIAQTHSRYEVEWLSDVTPVACAEKLQELRGAEIKEVRVERHLAPPERPARGGGRGELGRRSGSGGAEV